MLPYVRKIPYVKKRQHKAGMAPGTIAFVGEARTAPVALTLINYGPEHLSERPLENAAEAVGFRATPEVSWINLDGVHDEDVIRQIGTDFGIDALVLEDIVNTGQRPKLEEYDGYLFAVVKMLRIEEGQLKSEQVSLVVGPAYVVSFQEEPGDVFDPVRERIRHGRGRIRRLGADYLAYALLDVIVDHYFVVLEHFGEQTERLEEEVTGEATEATQQRINALRRDLVLMRRAVWPVRELLLALDRSDSDLVRSETRPFLRDAYDHAVQVIEVLESLREVLSGLHDLYMSNLSNRMNEVMKVLTIIGTIFIPLTFVAGIYGMNFEYMPELGYRYAYPIALAAMLIIGIVLVFYFRRKGWI